MKKSILSLVGIILSIASLTSCKSKDIVTKPSRGTNVDEITFEFEKEQYTFTSSTSADDVFDWYVNEFFQYGYTFPIAVNADEDEQIEGYRYQKNDNYIFDTKSWESDTTKINYVDYGSNGDISSLHSMKYNINKAGIRHSGHFNQYELYNILELNKLLYYDYDVVKFNDTSNKVTTEPYQGKGCFDYSQLDYTGEDYKEYSKVSLSFGEDFIGGIYTNIPNPKELVKKDYYDKIDDCFEYSFELTDKYIILNYESKLYANVLSLYESGYLGDDITDTLESDNKYKEIYTAYYNYIEGKHDYIDYYYYEEIKEESFKEEMHYKYEIHRIESVLPFDSKGAESLMKSLKNV